MTKRILLSKIPNDVVWLAWGAAKLANAAAHYTTAFVRNYTPETNVIVTVRHDPANPATDYVRVLRQAGEALKAGYLPNPLPYRAYVMQITPANPVSVSIGSGTPPPNSPGWVVYFPPPVVTQIPSGLYYHSPEADANTGGLGYPYDDVTCVNTGNPTCSGPLPPGIPSAYVRWSGTYKHVYTGFGSYGNADCEGDWSDYWTPAAAAAAIENAKVERGEHFTVVSSDGQPLVGPTRTTAALPSPGDIPADCLVFPRPSFDVSADLYYSTPPGSEVFAEWWALMEQATIARAAAWSKQCSDTVLGELRNGTVTMSPAWKLLLKQKAPASKAYVRSSPLMVAPTGQVVSPDGRRVVRTYTLSYTTTDANGTTTEHSTVVEGTCDITELTVSPYTTTTTYTNWLSDGGAPGLTANEASLLEDAIQGENSSSYGSVWNGVETSGYYPDSTFHAPTTDAYAIRNWPVYTNNITSTVLPFVAQYRATIPVKSLAIVGLRPDINDTALSDGQKVAVVLFGPAGKGIFAQWESSDTAVEVFGTATFIHTQGDFTFFSWAAPRGPVGNPNKGGGSITVSLTSPIVGQRDNAIVRYLAPKYPDIPISAKALNTSIKTLNSLTSLVFSVL